MTLGSALNRFEQLMCRILLDRCHSGGASLRAHQYKKGIRRFTVAA
jgi:hypothetical protein